MATIDDCEMRSGRRADRSKRRMTDSPRATPGWPKWRPSTRRSPANSRSPGPRPIRSTPSAPDLREITGDLADLLTGLMIDRDRHERLWKHMARLQELARASNSTTGKAVRHVMLSSLWDRNCRTMLDSGCRSEQDKLDLCDSDGEVLKQVGR
jgi:hypothetical protein